MNTKTQGFFQDKRNILLLVFWSAMCLALIVGVVLTGKNYQSGDLSQKMFQRKLWYALLCFIMMSVLYLFEFIVPIRFSLFLEIALPFFAFAALAGGTVFDFYGFSNYDKILHTLSGPLFSIVGLALADLLLKNQPESKRKVLASVAIAFFFALAVGYLWEIFEYSVDSIIPGFNNQRWQAGVLEEFQNGTYLVSDARGTGLHDTMWDMTVNLIGAVGFLVPATVICLRKPSRLKIFGVKLREKAKKPEKNGRKD